MRPRTLATLAVLGTLVPLQAGAAVSAPPAERPTACAIPTEQRGDTSALLEVTSGGLDRRVIVRLPERYESRDDWPLIVAFHGRGSTGTEVEGYSELDALPAVVAYPNGAIGTGSGHRQAWQGAPYEAPGVDDVAFTEDLLDELQSEYCVDPSRTFATGKSNGGGLAALLACRLPERIAAVAPVAAAYYPGTREGCEGAPPVPVIAVHGTGDSTIPYDGDADRDLPSVPDQVATWVARNECSRPVRTTRSGRDVTTYRHGGCAGGADVEHVAVAGGGHVWPGATVYSGGGYTTHDIETSTVIWRFFRRHQLDDRAHSTQLDVPQSEEGTDR